MEKYKYNISRFFDDKDLEKFVELTHVEAQTLIAFECEVLYNEQFNTCGGFVNIELHSVDENDWDSISGIIRSGIQNDCENRVYADKIKFNRKTLAVEYV